MAEDGLLPARVDTVEYHGADSIVAANAGGHPLLIRMPRHAPLAPGEEIRLTWRPDSQHLFNARTGERIPA